MTPRARYEESPSPKSANCSKRRRIHTLFSKSTHWKNYDIFAKQKISTFRSSRAGVLELATRYQELVTQLSSKSTEEIEVSEELLFIEMCEICLWGNATDLSLLTTLTMDDIQKLQGADARKAAEENVLINDLKGAYETLKKARSERPKEDRRVEIVLDNAGFELFVDIILAGYLLASNLATHVVLHPKSLPWFVSDVLPADFAELLNALADPQKFYTTQSDDDKHIDRHPESLSEKEVQELEFLFKHWSGFHSEGQLMLRPNDFWTQGGSFWRLPALAPRLLEDFKESALVIFKGDLNYRKLTADVFTRSHLSMK